MLDIAQLVPGEESEIVSLIRERLNSGSVIYIAGTSGTPAGVIEVYNNSHIFLLFISNEAKGTGVGKILLGYVKGRLAQLGVERITVNSSPNSVGFYKSQGFLQLAGEEEVHGIRSVKMQLLL
ncbi:N-acetylglutamate synthase-like GNAT family acetyltransferase [Paenibacillus sp. PastM-3]|uniref:GNAT family N-acetyltransferase n=1 Tax=unclassified Paenibacillus TaxID=185978 RepID=UPI002404D684|nr:MULTISPECIES: GNAT family N-acetyltransferase [unclassified Paenibacillus]MDF9851382.1 N-acetylglutamate synthase-like GNAT family acetyltransferase [Paenibacillus sp. PastM-2]MDH6483269.1 N-acetylglutamate synthase-like GNAT family acetyltransferase [Paenibacillus sp. PastH-2]MDH6510679.1 N-acetylglutamate synthase-like GNAT family acetyltransferase [Paenibacillus sp. PastM-3]